MNVALEQYLDVGFSPEHADLRLDIYAPAQRVEPVPLVVFIHGGGWRHGNRKLCPDLTAFCERSGFAVASIDYRLSNEAVFPAQIEDVKTSIRWLRRNAASYGYDAERIGLWGSSAGGHLAALAATSGVGMFEPRDAEVSSAVSAVVDGYAPTDMLSGDRQRAAENAPDDDPESLKLPPGYLSTDPSSFESMLFGRSISEIPEFVKRADPVTYVKAGLPPFLIMHGLSDGAVPHGQSVLLYEALASAGNEAHLGLVPGLGHGFFNRTQIDDGGPRMVDLRATSARFATGLCRTTIFGIVEEFFRDVFARGNHQP